LSTVAEFGCGGSDPAFFQSRAKGVRPSRSATFLIASMISSRLHVRRSTLLIFGGSSPAALTAIGQLPNCVTTVQDVG
jgi:hypothetical protein